MAWVVGGAVVAWVVVGGGLVQPSAGSPPEGQEHSSPLSVTRQVAPAAQGPGEHSAIEIPNRPSGTRRRKAEAVGRREWRSREVGRRIMAAWLPGSDLGEISGQDGGATFHTRAFFRLTGIRESDNQRHNHSSKARCLAVSDW